MKGLCMGGVPPRINVRPLSAWRGDMGPGHTIRHGAGANYGNRYQSKLFNPQFPCARRAYPGPALGLVEQRAPRSLFP